MKNILNVKTELISLKNTITDTVNFIRLNNSII